ncbi:MAG: leucyl aminopeptidase family protein [Bacteroidetes bacterium]|nr:leucyl aminopeptidase family protein [Bacteroidota bacterium]
MNTKIIKVNKVADTENIVFLLPDLKNLTTDILSETEIKYTRQQHTKNKKELISFNHITNWIFIQFIKNEKIKYKKLELCRKAGDKILAEINGNKINNIFINNVEGKADETLAFAEGMALSNYRFLKYKKEKKEKENSLKTINIFSKAVKKAEIDELNIIIKATNICRNLVNEPVSFLNAVTLSKEIKKMGRETGTKVEVLNKKKIEVLKMGGLLAVNKGSIDPPTFTIIEWKPDSPVNTKPYVFVGKGIVFDTGGLNIKTGNFMENMKSDMAGAAAVASAIYAISTAKLPVHVIGLIPATDNRLDGNAYVTGDIITMFDGTSVEVINTDAEGRMILADALSYAKKYNPKLVIDLSTLTGSAQRAIGKYGIVGMETKSEKEFKELQKSGKNVYERVVEFPFWDEYSEELKSEIADIKNIGGTTGGAITAGKFLEHFTKYPYIHLDIAGPAFLEKKDSYRGIGGSGTGVRLLFDFIKSKC